MAVRKHRRLDRDLFTNRPFDWKAAAIHLRLDVLNHHAPQQIGIEIARGGSSWSALLGY